MPSAMMMLSAPAAGGSTQPTPVTTLGSDLLAWWKRGTGIYDALVGGSLVTSDGQEVGRWEDQSGNGYHLVRDSAINSHFLTWRPGTTHLGAGTIQSFDSGTLDGTHFAVPDALMTALGSAGEGEIWCSWRARLASQGNGIWAFGNTGGSPNNHYEWTDGHVYDSWGSDTRKDTGDLNASYDIHAAFHVYNVYSKTSDWQSFYNNVSFYSTGSNTVAFLSTGAKILESVSSAYPWYGFVSEIVIAKKKVTTPQRTAIYNWLTSL